MSKARKGFTLIELLIVIAILGILVALILPRFADVREDANTKVCVANLRGLASAMLTYETKANRTVAWGSCTAANLVTWNYVSSEPHCPYETGASPAAYPLVAAAGSVPAHATCPQVATYTDHKWP